MEMHQFDDIQAFSISEAARRTSLSPATIYRRICEGKLQSIKNGHRRLIPASALRALLTGDVP